MHFGVSRFLLEAIGFSAPHQPEDEHLLAGADAAQLQALGASGPVLSLFRQDFATLSPDLVHEAQLVVGRR